MGCVLCGVWIYACLFELALNVIVCACVSVCMRVSKVSCHVGCVWSVLLWCVAFVKCVSYVVYCVLVMCVYESVHANVRARMCMCVHVSTQVCRSVCVVYVVSEVWCVMCWCVAREPICMSVTEHREVA